MTIKDQPLHSAGFGYKGKTMAVKQNNRLLIIDDEEMMRDILSQTLASAGFEAIMASSAEEALEIMHKDPMWILFVDLKLPGKNGTEFCRIVRDEWPMAILFAITGYSSLFELTDCRDAGFEDYFTKPVDRKLIVEAAENAFKRIDRWTKK
jgi:DNA-binding response OmpR family regulator